MNRRMFLLLVLLGLVPLSTSAQKAEITFDQRADFAAYRTYMWGEGTKAPNPLTDQRIIAGVDERLAKAGWRKVSSDADVIVAYHVSVSPETSIKSYSVGGPYNGYQWGLYSYTGGYIAGGTIGEGVPTDKIVTIDVGQLLIDMADVKTKNFFWRGSAKETLKDRDPDHVKKKVKSAISKLFKNFPPKRKSH